MDTLDPKAPPPAPNPPQSINLMDPDSGDIGSVPLDTAKAYLSQGYRAATPEETDSFVNDQKYGGIGQQAVTGLEGAAQAATFGLSTAAERAAGVPKEDITGRREANPMTHMLGQGAGLLGSAFIPGAGAANVLEHAGAAGAEALGLGATTGFAKIGSAAVKGAIENSLVQGGDELSRMIAQDPNQSVQTAITDVGLSALIGGGISGAVGAIHPLWQETSGNKLGGWLEAIQRRANGEAVELSPEIENALKETQLPDAQGLALPAELRAGMSEVPDLAKQFNTLQESKTMPGQNLTNTVETFKKDASDFMVKALGKTEDEILPKEQVSPYENGKELANTLHGELAKEIDPVADRMQARKERFGATEVSQNDIANIAQQVAQMANEQGWSSSPSGNIMQEVNRVLKEIPLQKDLKALGHFQTAIGDNTFNPMDGALTRAGQMMKGVVRDVESDMLSRVSGPEEAELLASDRSAYRAANEIKDQLNDRLHIKAGSVKSWLKGLKEMGQTDGETVLRRLSGKGDANLLELLQSKFPETAEMLKRNTVNEALSQAASKAPDGHTISSKHLMSAIDKMSPEMRKFALPEGAEQKLRAAQTLIDNIPSYRTSGTAGNLDSLWSKVPGGAMAMAAMLTGHNPALGFMIGQAGKWVSRDAPDAVRLAFLKFLGHDGPVEPAAFKSAVDFIQSTIKGQNAVKKGTQAVFTAGKQVLSETQMPTKDDREKLDKRLKALQKDTSPLLNTGGKTSYYMPEHSASMGQTAAQATNYLNSLRPNTDKRAPLDPKIKPSAAETATYNRALDIAEQPMLVLDAIKHGTLTPQDVAHLRSLYPDLYNKFNSEMMTHVIDREHDEEPIPYKTKLALSLFMGQPLDSTMTPESLMSTQPQMQGPAPGANGQPGQQPKHSMTAISKMSQGVATPGQAREMEKQSHNS